MEQTKALTSSKTNTASPSATFSDRQFRARLIQGSSSMTLYSAMVCWLIFTEILVLAILGRAKTPRASVKLPESAQP
jgi:hypothetical protein